jgi:hypothetical protein
MAPPHAFNETIRTGDCLQQRPDRHTPLVPLPSPTSLVPERSTRGDDMPVDDRSRINLHRRLETVLGPEEADTVMAHLPPVTWNEVATKDDLRSLEAATRRDLAVVETSLRGEIAALGTSLRSDMAAMESSLRSDMAAMESSLRNDMAGMDMSLRGEMAALRKDIDTLQAVLRHEIQAGDAGVRAALSDAITNQTKWIGGFAAVWSTLLVTVVGLVA